MARKEKPVKIIRYKTNRKGNRTSRNKVKKVLTYVVIALLIIGAGYLRTKFITNAVQNKKDKTSVSSQITVSTVTNESRSEETVISSQTEDSSVTIVEKDRIYYYTDVYSLTTESGIESVISKAKSLGANCILFDVKDSKGNIHYNSQNKYASQLKADSIIDLQLLVKKCSENAVTPVARMYTFMDQMISTVERSTAVMYQGTDTRWLDSSAALGGKAWANPASDIMQTYIKDLTDELLSSGIKEIVYAGFSTPTGYSLDKRDFGATTEQVLASMQSLIKTLKGKVSAKGGYCAWQIEYSAISANGSYAQYIVHPYRLGAENIIVTADKDTNVAEAAQTLSDSKPEEINSLTLWVNGTGSKASENLLKNYFVN